MKLIFVRHWETLENQAGILQGHIPWILSERWIQEAKSLARSLATTKIDYIYSSDLQRAVDTTKLLATYHDWITVTYLELLRERSFWDFEWRPREEYFNMDRDMSPMNCWETDHELFMRSKKFLAYLQKHYDAEGTFLIVSHWFFIKSMIAQIEWIPVEQFNTLEKLKNTSVTIVEWDFSQWFTFLKRNCINHLSQ